MKLHADDGIFNGNNDGDFDFIIESSQGRVRRVKFESSQVRGQVEDLYDSCNLVCLMHPSYHRLISYHTRYQTSQKQTEILYTLK